MNKYNSYSIILNKKADDGSVMKAIITSDGTSDNLSYKDKDTEYSLASKLNAGMSAAQRKQALDEYVDFIAVKFKFDFVDKQAFEYLIEFYNVLDLDMLLTNNQLLRFLRKYHFEIQWLMF